MQTKLQILLIHGGETFRNHKDYLNYLKKRSVSVEKKPKWALEYLDRELGKKFEIIRPKMPLQENAKYEEWKIYFERFIPLLRNNVILIGNSLGGIFLVKYLSENKFPKKILSVYLTCTPFDDTCPSDDLVGGFKLKSNISLIEKNCQNVTFMFSKDDEVVPVSHAAKYEKKLKKSKIITYKSKNGHFQISVFPEIIRMIKKDIKNIG